MQNYRYMALVAVYIDVEADSPEHADGLCRDLSLDNYCVEEWLDTKLFVEADRDRRNAIIWTPVPEAIQASLFE